MNPEQAKLKQREDARRRSRQAPRRASSQAVSSDQSEVTEEAPAVYRVPQINVPDDLQGVAKLIQTELAKIEQSQTILLSLWEKVKDQYNSHADIEFKKTIRVNSTADQKVVRFRPDREHWSYDEWRNNDDGSRDAYMGIQANSNDFVIQAEQGQINITSETGDVMIMSMKTFSPIPRYMAAFNDFNSAPWGYGMVSGAVNGPQGATPAYGTCLTMASQGLGNFATPADMLNDSLINGTQWWLQQMFWDTTGGYHLRFATNNGIWSSWQYFAIGGIGNIEAMKAEIYAELIALNPGIVIPQTD